MGRADILCAPELQLCLTSWHKSALPCVLRLHNNLKTFTGEPEQRPQEPPGGLGQGLHPDDMAAAGALLREFAERSLLPRVEERMARLNLAVSTARKGLKNRLTRLWKGAAAEPGPSMVRAAACLLRWVCYCVCCICCERHTSSHPTASCISTSMALVKHTAC